MSQYDNEIYRGPPESGPTLAQDTPSYGTDFYIVKPPQTTAQQDVPPTEETARYESRPALKKKSRIGKAMKLLASCAATVAVVTTLAAQAPPAPVEPVPELPLWPQIVPSDIEYVQSWTHFPISQNSGDCQVSIDGKVYCLTAKQKGVYLHWVRSCEQKSWHDFPHCFYLDISIPAENISTRLVFCVNPIMKAENLKSSVVKILTTSGKALYVHGGWGATAPNDQQILDNLNNYIQISDVTADVNADGWDYVLIGDTMYSETNEAWSGIQTVPPYDESDIVEIWEICHTAAASYSADDFICQRRVNDIDWSFYFASYRGNHTMWAVPAQEDVALGFQIGYINYYNNENWYMRSEMSDSEIQEKLQDELLDLVDRFIIGKGLCHYYPVEQMPERKPTDIPPDATVPSTEATTEAVTEPVYQCETNGHTWVDANYQAPKTCSVCGETEGGALLADFETHGLPINITQLDTEYDYLTSSADNPEFKTWGKLSLSNYRVFEGDADHPAMEGYEWHAVSVKIRFDDNIALNMGMHLYFCIENYYDIEGWDASKTHLEEENMTRYTCNVNGTDYTQCLYHKTEGIWSGWRTNPVTNISECSFTCDQYVRLPVGYDGVVLGYYDGGTGWSEAQHIYDGPNENTLFFRLDGTAGATPEATTEATEVPLTTEVETEYLPEGGTRTITSYYDPQGNLVKEEMYYDEDETETFVLRLYDEYGRRSFQESTTYNRNGELVKKRISDLQAAVTTEERFAYHENGVLSNYRIDCRDCYWDSAHKVYYSEKILEIRNEEYDESGTVIDTSHNIYDPETGLWQVEDYEEFLYDETTDSYDTSLMIAYSDGLFSEPLPWRQGLVEGIYQQWWDETGNLHYDYQKNADGSGKAIWYYSDGSLEQSEVITIDEETNTWIEITEYHPKPSDDFAYHHETRVRFYDDGRIAEYYYNSDGHITEIQFDENDQTEAEYDENGRMIKCRHSENGYLTEIWFEYDQFGRLEEVGSNTWRE